MSLNLPSWYYRSIKGNLIFLIKLLSGLLILFFPQIPIPKDTHRNFTCPIPTGERQCRSNYFSVRIINHWNQLSDEIVDCTQ